MGKGREERRTEKYAYARSSSGAFHGNGIRFFQSLLCIINFFRAPRTILFAAAIPSFLIVFFVVVVALSRQEFRFYSFSHRHLPLSAHIHATRVKQNSQVVVLTDGGMHGCNVFVRVYWGE